MLGVGLFSKVKWVLPVSALLFLIIWRGAFFVETFCVNVDLLRLRVGGEAQCIWSPIEVETGVRPEKTRLIWLQGYNLWGAGNFNRAMAVWQEAPQYAAVMLTTWVQNGGLAEANIRKIALTQALQLDPNTLEISEIASFHFFEGRQWETAYVAFTAVNEVSPDNAVAKAALALAAWHLNQPESEVLALYDTAVVEAPDNIYVLRYGLRLMQMLPSFGEERIARLAVLSAERLPRDFEFAFGVANAFRNLGNLETAEHYNLMTLSINSAHPWANLQQVELIQSQDEMRTLEPWLQQAIDNRVKNRPDYYRRLLAVLVESGAFSVAEDVYCDGRAQGFLSEALLRSLEDDTRIRLEKTNCHFIE